MSRSAKIGSTTPPAPMPPGSPSASASRRTTRPTPWQRDLAVSHYKLGDVAERRGDTDGLRTHWTAVLAAAMLAVFDGLIARGLHVSPADLEGLQAIRARVDELDRAAP